ncbi:MAG TPA: aspartate kinase, partial [Bacillota bacterium]|nr:aspartate kinase [Bacillota bacterium]
MAIIVQKYGGTSVETIEKINNIAEHIVKRKSEGNDMVIVVSAMGKTTDHLINMAHEISPDPDKRELDVLMATGEQVSMSLLSIALNNLDADAVSFTGQQVGIRTNGSHTKSKIADINEEKIREEHRKGKIVIVAGFQGVNEYNEITTLGRGGSDTTAVALAAKLGAQCEIYTDVDGIYTIDPRLYPRAKKLDCISYEEMLEMASSGASVMHSRSIELAEKYKVPVLVAL